MTPLWRRTGISLLLATVMASWWGIPVFAANLPAYDLTPQRTRLLTAQTTGAAEQFYSPYPIYTQIPSGTQSFSTPNVVGNTVYQYTWDSGGQGYLSAFSLPTLSANAVQSQAGNTGYVTQSAAYAKTVIQFNAGFSGTNNLAASQASLSTGPYLNGQPDGTQYQGIGVGKYLYSWPANQYPPGGTPSGSRVYIYGNHGNNDFQVDDSPLITLPITVSGTNDSTFLPVTWQSPVAVIGSWDGGEVALPTYVPLGDSADAQYYTTSQTSGGISGTPQFPHSTADITSDPTWIGNVPGVGSDCVAFGVDGAAHPRVVIFDVATGAYKDIGLGVLQAGVPDATLYDTANQTLYVQDLYGALYAFTLTGTLVAHYWPSSWTSSQTIVADDMALAGSTLYAVGGGGNLFGAFTTGLQPIYSNAITNQYAPGVASPSVIQGPSGNQTVVVSNEKGSLWLRNRNALFVLPNNTYSEAFATPVGSHWIGYQPDAGATGGNHFLIGWTNSDPQNHPAVVAYVQSPFAITSTVSIDPVPSGQLVAIRAYPQPQSITASSTYGPPGTGSPVDFETFTSSGLPVTNWASMQRLKDGHWITTWYPPINNTSQPITYTVDVAGWDELDQEAKAPPITVTVEPTPPPPTTTPTNQGTLSLQCGYGAGGPHITVFHSCTLPAWTAGNPPAWFPQNPQYGAKFGDSIDLSLTVPWPQKQLSRYGPSLKILAEELQASVPYTEGLPNAPGYRGYVPGTGNLYNDFPVTEILTPTGANSLTATGYVVESWDGYPPPQGQGLVQGSTYTLRAEWHLLTTYQWTKVWYTPGVATKTDLHPAPIRHQETFTHTLPTEGVATAPVTVNGTDYYEVATPTGY